MHTDSMKSGELGLLLRAVLFAAQKHRDQRRKGAEATPYINHPIEVASVLIHEAHVTDLSVLCAALLHDCIEDTQTAPEELERLFGREIKDIVLEVSDDKSLPKAQRKQLQIDHGRQLSPKAKLVKLADKICNLRDVTLKPPTDWSPERRQEYFDWAKRVADQLRGVNPVLEQAFDEAYQRGPRDVVS